MVNILYQLINHEIKDTQIAMELQAAHGILIKQKHRYSWTVSGLINNAEYMKIVAYEKRLELMNILITVCDFYKVHIDGVTSKSRKREFVEARHTYFYLAYTKTNFKDYEIAELTNNDRSAVINGYKTVDEIAYLKKNAEKIIELHFNNYTLKSLEK